MSLALSPRRAGRHPVGLSLVVGLHVALATLLLSARLEKGPAEPAPIALRPLDPVKPVEPAHVDLPRPQQPVLHPTLLTPPLVVEERQPDTIAVPPDAPERPAIVASLGGGDPGASGQPPRATPHAARIDAGAPGCRPEYPAAAQRAGATGTTRLRFSVDAAGRISGSQLVQSSGPTRENRLLDKAAAEALARCPVQVGTDELGRPSGTTTEVTYVWSLN